MKNENHNSYSLRKIIVIIFNYSIDVGFVLLPLVGYIHQYMKIKTLKSTEGFSKFVSFILIMSYIIRIFFWIGHHFEIKKSKYNQITKFKRILELAFFL